MAARWCLLYCLTYQITTMASGDCLTLPITSFISTSRAVKPTPLSPATPSPTSPKISSPSSFGDIPAIPHFLNAIVENNHESVVTNKQLPNPLNGINLESKLQYDPIVIKKPLEPFVLSQNAISPTCLTSAVLKPVSLNTAETTRDINNFDYVKAPANIISSPPVLLPIQNINGDSNPNKAQIVIKAPTAPSLCVSESSPSPKIPTPNCAFPSKTVNSPSFLSQPNLCSNHLISTSVPNMISTDIPKPGLSSPIGPAIQPLTLNCLSTPECGCVSNCPESLRSVKILPDCIPSVNFILTPDLPILETGFGQGNDYFNFASSMERSKPKACTSGIIPVTDTKPIIYPGRSTIPPMVYKSYISAPCSRNLSYLELLGSPTFRLPAPNEDISLLQRPNISKPTTLSNPTVVYNNINSIGLRDNRFTFLNSPDFILPTPNCNAYTNYFNKANKVESPNQIPSKSPIRCPINRPVNTVLDNTYLFPTTSNNVPLPQPITPEIRSFTPICSASANTNVVHSLPVLSNVLPISNGSPNIKISNNYCSPSTCPTISFLPSPTLPFNPFSCSKEPTSGIRLPSNINTISLPATNSPPVFKPVVPNVDPATLPSSRRNINTEFTSENILEPSIVATPSLINSDPKYLPPITAINPPNTLDTNPYKLYTSIDPVPPKVPGVLASQSITPNIYSTSKITQVPSNPFTTPPTSFLLVNPKTEYVSTPIKASTINDITSALSKSIMASINFNNLMKRAPNKANAPRKNTIKMKSTVPILIKPKPTAVIPRSTKQVAVPLPTISEPEIDTLSLSDDNPCENCLSDIDSSLLSNIIDSLCNIKSESTLLSSNSMMPYISSITIDILPAKEGEETVIDLMTPEYSLNDVTSSEIFLDPKYIDHLQKLLALSDLLNTKDDEYIDFDVIEEIYRLVYAA